MFETVHSRGWKSHPAAILDFGNSRRYSADIRKASRVSKKIIRRKLAAAGFSLIEMLVTLAIVMILASMAIPATQSTISSYRLTAAVENASGAIQGARYQAIMHGYSYQVVFSSTAGTYLIQAWDSTSSSFKDVGSAVPISSSPVTVSADTTLQFKGKGSVSATVGLMNFSLSYKGKTKALTVSNYGSISVQ